jgi:hypothetical protein
MGGEGVVSHEWEGGLIRGPCIPLMHPQTAQLQRLYATSPSMFAAAGQFAAGVRHGQGRCVYADGTLYEGHWEGDQRSGKGACVFANGDKYQGV